MAAATLDISWTAVYVGQHRVCWRIVPNLVYDCTTVIYCGGGACSVSIPITIENESCDQVTYEGYVQPSCEDPNSLNGRVPFNITFTPVPTCKAYQVTCISVPVLGGTVITPGYNYDPLNPPAAVISGGGGAGATATITIGNSMSLTDGGTGYTPGVYNNVALINGLAVGGLATVTVDGSGSVLSINDIVITTNGDPFLPTDIVTFDDVALGGGTGLEILLGSDYGRVTGVVITTAGDDYTSVPIITVDPPQSGLFTTEITMVLNECKDQDMGISCDTETTNTITRLGLNLTVVECMTTVPDDTNEMTFIEGGCCYDCVQITVTPDETIFFYYTDCITHNIVNVKIDFGDDPLVVCAVNNSWYWAESSVSVTIVTDLCIL